MLTGIIKKWIHLREQLEIPQKFLVKLLLIQHFLICSKKGSQVNNINSGRENLIQVFGNINYIWLFLCDHYLLTAIWFIALQQCGTNTLSDSAGWHWKQKQNENETNKLRSSTRSLVDDIYLGRSSTHVSNHSAGYTSLKDVRGCKVEHLF